MFTFAWPLAFLLLPLFWLVQKVEPQTHKQNEAMLRVPFLSRIQALNSISTPHILVPYYLKQFLGISAWGFLVVACANPQWLGDPLPLKQDGRNIMLAIDLSKSMEIPDLKRNNVTISRLQTVKEVAADFIEKRQGDKIGLILFGSKPYLQTPLTFDRKTVLNMLNDATIGLAGGRTAIGDAIGLAVKKFSNENIKSRTLILLTDGGDNNSIIEPLKAAELAKDNQIKIYTIGIGASEMVINGIFGNHVINPSIDLDEKLLKQISNITQGQYFRARDENALIKILEAINQLEPISAEYKTVRPITALFYWPLLVSLLLFSILIFPTIGKVART